jgi:hypothetical protein
MARGRRDEMLKFLTGKVSDDWPTVFVSLIFRCHLEEPVQFPFNQHVQIFTGLPGQESSQFGRVDVRLRGVVFGGIAEARNRR